MGESSTIDDIALNWFALLRNEASPAQRAEFERWIEASPAHRTAYRRVESLWAASGDAGLRAADRDAAALSRHLDVIKTHRRRKGLRKGGTVVAGILGLGLVTGIWFERPHLLQDLRADTVTDRGERRTVVLADGSSILVDADSALMTDISPRGRRVTLLRGSAFFNVAKIGTPFVVEAGGGEITVVGTQFDVRAADQGSVVTVSEGRVTVAAPGSNPATLLEKGQQIRFDAKGAESPRLVDLDEAMSWHDGRFVFYQARLGDVIDEIRRYRKGRILVLDTALANRRVTGSFSLDDPDQALESLRATVGFSVSKFGPRLVVLR